MKKLLVALLVLTGLINYSAYGLTDQEKAIITKHINTFNTDASGFNKVGEEMIKLHPKAANVIYDFIEQVKNLNARETPKFKAIFIASLQAALKASPNLVITEKSLEDLEQKSPHFSEYREQIMKFSKELERLSAQAEADAQAQHKAQDTEDFFANLLKDIQA